jgi:hypothetical protein
MVVGYFDSWGKIKPPFPGAALYCVVVWGGGTSRAWLSDGLGAVQALSLPGSYRRDPHLDCGVFYWRWFPRVLTWYLSLPFWFAPYGG